MCEQLSNLTSKAAAAPFMNADGGGCAALEAILNTEYLRSCENEGDGKKLNPAIIQTDQVII